MKKNTLWVAFTAIALSATAQTTIPNGDFENWGNVAPGNADEPTGWYSNRTGSSNAQVGPQTAYQENTNPHSGNACVRVETKSVVIATVNGNLTTGVINAPTTVKSRGYVGTMNFSTPTDIRRTPFVGRPDSLVGWYKYTSAGASGGIAEKGKVAVILHTGHYNDPEVPVAANASVYSDVSANRVGSALFNTPTTDVATWTRFSVPFNYASGITPEYIMISITSSDNQLTSIAGSKLWLDDLEVIYNATPGTCDDPSNLVVTQNTNSVDLSWTAAATTPVGGYGYCILNADSTQTPLPFYNTTNTFKNGITTTQAQFSENLVVGATYNAYVISLCGPSPLDTALTLTSNYISTSFVYTGVVGVNETTASKFNIYAHDKHLTVDLTNEAAPNAILSIIDLTGKEVLKVNLKGNEKNNISIPASVKSGTYFYTVIGTSIQKTGKIAF